jgi:hypothetical protein
MSARKGSAGILFSTKLARIGSRLAERHQLYLARFIASEHAVTAALIAQKELVSAAFLASEKAIVKAEDAQREYNIRSNEFRGQLDDQAKTLLPRQEAAALFHAIDDRLASAIKDHEKRFDDLRSELASLRESRAAAVGQVNGISDSTKVVVGAIMLLIAVLGFFGLTIRWQAQQPAATAPQVIYVPSPPGTMLPSTPPQPVPR